VLGFPVPGQSRPHEGDWPGYVHPTHPSASQRIAPNNIITTAIGSNDLFHFNGTGGVSWCPRIQGKGGLASGILMLAGTGGVAGRMRQIAQDRPPGRMPRQASPRRAPLAPRPMSPAHAFCRAGACVLAGHRLREPVKSVRLVATQGARQLLFTICPFSSFIVPSQRTKQHSIGWVQLESSGCSSRDAPRVLPMYGGQGARSWVRRKSG
jgi:hypothetical protein